MYIKYTRSRLCNQQQQSLITLTHFVYSSSDSNNPTAAITACGNAGQWQQAKQLIVQMKESGVQPNVITYTAALNACGKVRAHIHTVLRILTPLLHM
jgi:pentatricopeptide repeat protein